MNRVEEFISKKEQEVEQLRKDWHPELWALVMEAYAKSQERENIRIALKHCRVAGKHFCNDKDEQGWNKGIESLRRAIKKLERIAEPPKTKDK